MSRCSLFIIFSAAFIAAISGKSDVEKAIDDVTTTKDGAMYCPAILVGTQCPSSSIFHYYKCCGDLNKDCCFNLQVWVIVVLAVIAVIMLASFVLSVIRCLCCRR